MYDVYIAQLENRHRQARVTQEAEHRRRAAERDIATDSDLRPARTPIRVRSRAVIAWLGAHVHAPGMGHGLARGR